MHFFRSDPNGISSISSSFTKVKGLGSETLLLCWSPHFRGSEKKCFEKAAQTDFNLELSSTSKAATCQISKSSDELKFSLLKGKIYLTQNCLKLQFLI